MNNKYSEILDNFMNSEKYAKKLSGRQELVELLNKAIELNDPNLNDDIDTIFTLIHMDKFFSPDFDNYVCKLAVNDELFPDIVKYISSKMEPCTFSCDDDREAKLAFQILYEYIHTDTDLADNKGLLKVYQHFLDKKDLGVALSVKRMLEFYIQYNDTRCIKIYYKAVDKLKQ